MYCMHAQSMFSYHNGWLNEFMAISCFTFNEQQYAYGHHYASYNLNNNGHPK